LVAKAEHPKGGAESKSEADVKSLMAEFLASTREPIGSSGLFRDPFDASPSQASKRRASKMEYSDPKRDLSWLLLVYLIAVTGAMVAVALFLWA
jgi:hypothetical protein